MNMVTSAEYVLWVIVGKTYVFIVNTSGRGAPRRSRLTRQSHETYKSLDR